MRRHAWLLAVLGLLCMVFHLVSRVAWGTWAGWPAWVGGAGLALWLAWLWVDQNPLRRAARSRAVRSGLTGGLLVVLAVGLAIGLNALAQRYDHRWDLTTSGRHSLAPQTVQILEALSSPVRVVAFFPAASPDERSFLDLLEAYEQHTDALELELYDQLRDVAAARQYGVTSAYGTVILESGDDRQRLETSFDEQSLTNALLRISSGVEHSLCFLSDHGEADPDDDEPGGVSGAVMKLEDQNYRVERASILQHGGVPEHCEALLVIGPMIDPLPEEREAIAAYLVAGGSVLMLIEPLAVPALAEDLDRYGLSLVPDVVLVEDPEMQQLGLDPSHLRITPEQLDFHPITNALEAVVYLQLARTVEKAEGVPVGLNVQVLARTVPDAWGETSLDEGMELEPTPELDRVGSLGVAAAVEITDPSVVELAGHDLVGEDSEASASPAVAIAGGKLVVFGDAGFATNAHLLEGLNQDLLLNSVAWLVGEEDQISIRPNEEAAGLLEMSLLQALVVWFLALFGVPGLAIIAAIWTWIRRRRL